MKYHFLTAPILFLLLTFVAAPVIAQQTIMETTILKNYTNALKLYNDKAYAAAQKNFEKASKTAVYGSNLKSDAAYFEAMCAIKLNHTDADKKVISFVDENPNSSKKNVAYYNVGNYYFANKKPAYALKWYKKVDIEALSKENVKELNFKMGYSLLVTKFLKQAKQRFSTLVNDPKYGNDSRYYYGYIAYKQEDYELAESTFEELADNATYKSNISYYLLDISFKAGKFKRSIQIGKKLLPKAKRNQISDISKIIGESYFNLEKYRESIPYLKAYKGKGKRRKWNNVDYYQLGYAYYKQNDFKNASNNFNKIIDQKNVVAQNAYYHLGECYLNLEKKNEALNAFKSASEMDFNPKIQQDAALNYAKLSYDAGNPFEPVSEVLQHYLKTYPKSKSYNEINKLVVSSFINQQDFKGALAYLSKKKSNENTPLTQEVSLYRAMQLFNENKYKEALPFFSKSEKSTTLEIQQKANYWNAETLYRLENYTKAVEKFIHLKKRLKQHTNEDFKLIDYNIGYSYFKLKKYEKAQPAFKNFLKKNSIEKAIKQDAFVRLGDSYFASRKYAKAIKSYQKVIDEAGAGADYAQYQIGMSYGFIDQHQAKIDALKKVVSKYQKSNLKDDALYQLANTYTKLKDHKNAHFAYNRLLEKYPKSTFLSRALLRQGLLYYNDNMSAEALIKYKEVTKRFPNSPDALEAVANARKVYIDKGNLKAYVNWIATLKFVNVENADLDNTAFAVAEKKYLEGKNNTEINKSLLSYNRDYPDGVHKLKANFYLAKTLFKTKEFTKAIPYYKVVLSEEQNEFSEESLSKLSQIYLENEDFNKALPLLVRLEQEAYSLENILYAQSNLMKGYYETNAYDLAITYAKKLLQKEKLDTNVENDAKKIIARASIKTKDFRTAKEYYTAIEKTASGKLKAEALYYNAYFKNQQKNYAASNKIIQKLIANYSAYKYWGVKSYVIMGKNYYGLKDVYQATFVLENVIKNFKEFGDIIKEAQKELNTIKESEAKTNNSVTPQKKNG
ncbi:MAG: tetratricopeptide repeat protein [Polaribacter sp.]